MMAQGMKRKNRFINLLSGKFAQASFSEIPLHSFAFISTRIAIVSFVIFISLITERFFIEKDIKQVNLKLSQVLKNDSLGVNPRLRRAIATNPRPVLESLEKNLTGIRQEISTIQSALKIKSLSPLLTISQSAASTTSTLINYKTTEAGDVMASFSAESVEELIQLKALLEKSELSNLVMQINESKLLLTLTAKVN
jgi:hypothetical protein